MITEVSSAHHARIMEGGKVTAMNIKQSPSQTWSCRNTKGCLKIVRLLYGAPQHFTTKVDSKGLNTLNIVGMEPVLCTIRSPSTELFYLCAGCIRCIMLLGIPDCLAIRWIPVNESLRSICRTSWLNIHGFPSIASRKRFSLYWECTSWNTL